MASYYAQFQTDLHIEKYFPGDYIGTCIEIGAGKGMELSNTGYFEKKFWKCLCLEPIQDLFYNLRMYRRLCLNVCCGHEDLEEIDFYVYELVNNNLEAISSYRPDPRLLELHRDNIVQEKKIKTKLRKLDTILKWINIDHIDFISIDTGGNEIDVLKGFDLDKWKVKLIVIQNNFSDPEIKNLLELHGYVFRERHGVNDFYEFVYYKTKSPNLEEIFSVC
jgi:FkbM family methyltransferase